MNVDQARGFISAYAKFVEANMVPVQQGNGVCISTPMLNRNNDCMRFIWVMTQQAAMSFLILVKPSMILNCLDSP